MRFSIDCELFFFFLKQLIYYFASLDYLTDGWTIQSQAIIFLETLSIFQYD